MADLGLKQAIKTSFLPTLGVSVDPVHWMEENFGVELFSNQIENIETLFNESIPVFSILATRGAGKTWNLAAGLAAYCILRPGLRVIIVGPKEKQAGRIIKEMVSILKDKKCRVGSQVDWARSSALRLQFKNGSYCVALSGQEGANVEGEHGHILVIDEAHKVPTYSVTNKLTPMVGMLDMSKIVKIGVAMGRNHFYKTCVTPKAVVNKCPWHKAEIFLQKDKNPLFYKKRQYPRSLIARMPLPYKKKYFPDRPDLQQASGMEISVLDWETQYELEWVDDISNFLSDEDQELLAAGTHNLLTKGMPGEVYTAGLDTAQGSLVGRKGTDETVLGIWRKRGDLKEKVATFIWRGDPLAQKEEIWNIINPKTGLFKCKLTLVDYSNIGIDIVELFKSKGVPIMGILFGATESRSKKNFKNAMYDHFAVELQTEKLVYPDIKKLEELKISESGEMLVQVQNTLRSYWEWTAIQRVRGRGLNDQIGAPNDAIESEDGDSSRAFDDCCFTGDTLIKLLDGTTRAIKDIAAGELGGVYTYSLDKALRIVPGKVTRAWKTGTRETVVVTLDSGESFRCTPDHRIMLRDGTYAPAGELLPGTSVMPLYTQMKKVGSNTSEYEGVYNPADGLYEFTHRLIFGSNPGKVIHHKNFNRLDNRPENLESLGVFEHIKLHGDNAAKNNRTMWDRLSPEERSERAKKAWAGTTKEQRREILSRAAAATRERMKDPILRKAAGDRGSAELKKLREAPDYLEKKSEQGKARWAKVSKEERSELMRAMIDAAAAWHKTHPSHRLGERKRWEERVCELAGCGKAFTCRMSSKGRFCCKSHSAQWREDSGHGQKGKPAWNRGNRLNHKIVSVTPGGVEDVYDLTVEAHHNFALACGVFVHNCSADILGIWAVDKLDQLMQEMAKGGDLSDYVIPMGVSGSHSLSGASTSPAGQTTNPLAMSTPPSSVGGVLPNQTGNGWLTDVMSGARSKKR